MYWSADRIPKLSLMWPVKPKELPTPAIDETVIILR